MHAAVHKSVVKLLYDDECRWAEDHGVSNSLVIARFDNGLRGATPKAALAEGEVALSVPEAMLIHSGTALASDLGQAIARVPGVDHDTVKLLWTMAEMHDSDSPLASFWQSLPGDIVTGACSPALGLFALSRTVALSHRQSLSLRCCQACPYTCWSPV